MSRNGADADGCLVAIFSLILWAGIIWFLVVIIDYHTERLRAIEEQLEIDPGPADMWPFD